MREISLTEYDRLIYENEIRPFLPDRLFDAHCHLLPTAFHPRLDETMPVARDPMLRDVDAEYMAAWWRALFPHSNVSGMIMGFPTEDADAEGENAFVAEAANRLQYPFALMTRPEAPPNRLDSDIRRLKPAALKPYKCFVRGKDQESSEITDLIPEPQLELANAHRLAVVLHVAKPRGMADEDNLRELARLVRDYPNCDFVLAHCGRCFITPNMEAALEKLPVAENLWLDTSAVCDMGVFISLLSRYDRSRIVFGTDLVTASAFRGSYVRLGMSWHMCTSQMVGRPGGMPDKSTFAVYENVCALCHAMGFCKLEEHERRAIFFDNGARLLALARRGESA